MHLGLTRRVGGFFAVWTAFVMVASAFSGSFAPTSAPQPGPQASYTAFPTADPDDGKFMSVAGQGLNTLAGIAVIAYVGLPAGTSSYDVGIFDGDTGGAWDWENDFPVLNYRLYRDPLKNGTTAGFVTQWTSTDAVDDAWYTKTFSTDSGAEAPSGNYFYRLEANWANSQSTSFNNFKIRTTGQISLRAGEEFGFTGGPQNIPGDPCVGSPDPNPGDTNDAGANTYNGDWRWYFYVPTVLTSIAFRDGDSDRWDDENSPGQPADDGTVYGPCAEIQPSIYYSVTDPESHVFTNPNPSGNEEWEDFTIGPNATDDVRIDYTLHPGLWQMRVQGQDAHNFNVLRANFEVYSNTDPPFTVNPTPELEPDREATTPGGVTLDYAHKVTNRGAPNSYDLSASSAHGWVSRIYHDENANGRADPGEPQVTQTPTLDEDETYQIVVQIDVPSGTGTVDDLMTVLASSRTEWAVQDDAKDTTHVRPNNRPTSRPGGPYSAPEGSTITFDGGGSTDSDGDPLTYRWDFDGDGTWDTPSSSNPTATFTWGDDWTGTALLEVSDGELTDTSGSSVTVFNVAPTIALAVIPSGDEADALVFEVQVTDPGSDDILYTWSGDCTGWSAPVLYPNDPSTVPDPDPSPDVHPRDVTDAQTIVCGDDAVFAWNLKVEDDDAGITTSGGTFSVSNLAPGLTILPPDFVAEDEGVAWTLTAAAEDPGSDDLTFTWTWELGPTESTTYYNDGASPDPDASPGGTFPFAATDSSTHTYGDDGS
ncbi:MAG TPA: PKD domain-containing protein, partial [Thermoplasmata archaeon]|nr:PKD domain-containing protein [Thermoplasmata archaeon]